MNITELKKNQVWNHFIERWATEKMGGGYGVTGSKLGRVKDILWYDSRFWGDIVIRHELLRQTPEQLFENQRAIYEYCLGNFWGMIYQEMINCSMVKKR